MVHLIATTGSRTEPAVSERVEELVMATGFESEFVRPINVNRSVSNEIFPT